jgi:hypothetical protein
MIGNQYFMFGHATQIGFTIRIAIFLSFLRVVVYFSEGLYFVAVLFRK